LNRLRAFLVLILGSAILGCATTGSGSSGASVASDADDAQHRILVMVHLPPPHFRPNADYAGGYGEESGRIARRRIAAKLAREHGLKLDSDWPMPVVGLHCFVMDVPGNASPDRIAEILAQDPRVEWAQPVRLFHAMGRADPLSSLQPGTALWHLSEIHQAATGRNVRVAIVDSGIEAEHPDLAGQVEFKENLVDGSPYAAETHGTAVAGIIAALAGNGIGIAGIAPDARLLAMRACWEESRDVTTCNSFTLGKALHSAIMHGAQVINLSLTGPSDRLLRRLLDAALARGIKLVGAVDPHSKDGGFPASHPGVLAVADEESAAVAAGGMHMVIAPGRDIPTTVPGARWNFVSGPSFAAAHVSGLVALITELQPALAPALIQKAMGADPDGIPAARTVDACATFARLAGTCSCSCTALHAAPYAHP
jgi:hypothetical protein